MAGRPRNKPNDRATQGGDDRSPAEPTAPQAEEEETFFKVREETEVFQGDRHPCTKIYLQGYQNLGDAIEKDKFQYNKLEDQFSTQAQRLDERIKVMEILRRDLGRKINVMKAVKIVEQEKQDTEEHARKIREAQQILQDAGLAGVNPGVAPQVRPGMGSAPDRSFRVGR